jgi:monoamine oxidase
MSQQESDYCVVGAGYAGLTAAYRLHRAGHSVAVLEAAPRIGGRTWSAHLSDGTRLAGLASAKTVCGSAIAA